MDSQVAVKAVIQRTDGKFLIVREGPRWQAVGGRLEPGEKLEEGLRREVGEETGITDFSMGKVIHVDEWFAKPEGDLKHIVALFFHCQTTTKNVRLSSEHEEFAWILPDELEKYDGLIENEIRQAILFASLTE